MQTLATLARHIITYTIGMLVAWLAVYLTGPDLKAATDAANALVEPLVILAGFGAVIVSRLAMPWLNKIFSRAAGEEGSGGSGGGLNLLGLGGILMISTAAVGTLPSCAPSGDEYPLTASISFRDESGAKAGLTYTPRIPRVVPTK